MNRKHFSAEMQWELCRRRCERDYETSPIKDMVRGPRKVYFATDNVGAASKGAWLFSFGAYGNAHVVAFGHLEDALEDAAAVLKTVSPGMFVEPEYPEGLDDMSEEEQQQAMEDAETDLTYTESGYLASWEWTVDEVTLEQVRAFVSNK